MYNRTVIIAYVGVVAVLASSCTLLALPAQSDPSAADIDQWLNGTDTSWGQAPAAQAPQSSSMQSWPSSQAGMSNNSPGWQRAADRPRIQGTPLNRPRTTQQPFGRLTPQDVFRIMFGGGGGGGSSGDYARNQAAYGNSSSYLQTALDQAAQAEDAAARASYGSDKYARQSAAAEAQNHANAARGAADSATSAASGATGAAQDQAAKARDAANRAQYAADRAAANANGGGW